MVLATRFLKVIVLLFGCVVLGLGLVLIPQIYQQSLSGSDRMALVLNGLIVVLMSASIALFSGLYQFYRLLMLISSDSLLSQTILKRLQNIKKNVFVVATIFTFGFPLFYLVGEVDDAPGVIVIGLFFVFIPLIISACLNILNKVIANTLKLL